jgi:outer membrane protein assembly factor BamB
MRATTVARGVVVDAGGDLYVAGWTGGALDGNTLKGERDSFLMKYDSSGTRVYTEQTGTTETDTAANGVVVDAGGNAYVVGWTSGGLDKDTYPGTHDSFIIKYNPSGAKVYMRQTGTAGKNVFASGVTADARGNVYVTGKTYGGLDGKKLMGKLDAFLMKYDPSGTKVYTEQTGTAGKNTLATGVAVDANGNVYVTGNTNGGLDGNKLIGTTDSFLMKYDPSGAKVFTKQIGTPGIETVANGVAVDAGGMVYVAGNTNGGLDGKILIGTTYAFLMKHDSSGTKVYTRQLGATKKNTYASGVAVDANGNVYVTGYTDGGLDGNSLIGIEDYFVTKYDPAGNKQ